MPWHGAAATISRVRICVVRLAALWLVGLCVASACASAPSTVGPLAGRYRLSGGGGALPVAGPLTEAFAKLHPGVVWVIEDIGSDGGVHLAANGSIDLGMVSRSLKAAEQSEVQAVPIGYSATGLATNAGNPVAALTKQQGRGIFSGAISDWSTVGGRPGRIVVLVREVDSATRISVESYFFDGNATFGTDAVEVHDIDETLRSIRSFKDSIGMLSVNALTLGDRNIKFLAIDGVVPTAQSVRNGTYPIRRELFFVAHPTNVKPAIRAFLDFVRSQAGQKIIAEN